MMRRWGLLGLLVAMLVGFAAPAWSEGSSPVLEGLRDHGKDWLKDKARSGIQDWLLSTDQSDTMKAILDRVSKSSESDMPGQASERCKVAVYSQIFSILKNLGYKTAAKEGASVVIETGLKTIGLAVGGLGAAGEGATLNWLAGQYADAAAGQAEDTLFDAISKLFEKEHKPEFEVFEQEGKCGLGDKCDYSLKALWDIVHGRYYVYFHGDCHCSRQNTSGDMLGEWWVAYSGPMLMKVSEDKKSFTWVPGEPKPIDMDADCPCSHKTLRTAYAAPPKTTPLTPGTPPPPPPPTDTEGWLKVATTCEPCKGIATEINTAAKELEQAGKDLIQAKTEFDQAKSQVDIDAQGGDAELGIKAPTAEKIKADKEALEKAETKFHQISQRELALKTKLKELWGKLKKCEQDNCGHYGMVVPGHGVCVPASDHTELASALAAGVLAEINQARADPAGYASKLKGGDGESVAFLQGQPPLPPLTENASLDAAARREAADQGPVGGASHTGRDGSTPMSRIASECVIAMVVGEEISLQQKTPGGVVSQLIVDSSSPHHFHRADLFSSSFTQAGVACGPNAAWGEMCVVDLAAVPAEY